MGGHYHNNVGGPVRNKTKFLNKKLIKSKNKKYYDFIHKKNIFI